MPIYIFYCEKCNNKVEEIVNSFYDVIKCKKCGNEMKKIFDNDINLTFNFVGSGFYENDYKKGIKNVQKDSVN